ncbi:hypothetical protein FACS1894186_1540 [Alphaproteobacteria bacterium]|nr:hypothetical protein FACS1894186_1540 [Alphaproteobacteria bacterium]
MADDLGKDAETISKINELVARADQLKKEELMDLSSDQDLSIAIMNLISIEEHLIFSGSKTGKGKFYDLVNPIRQMRKELLQRIVVNPEGEVWCTSKHLLAASMRLMEVGTKAQSSGKPDDAEDLFGKSFDLYSLFWGLNMNLIGDGEAKATAESAAETPRPLPDGSGDKAKNSAILAPLKAFVKKAVDCCRE